MGILQDAISSHKRGKISDDDLLLIAENEGVDLGKEEVETPEPKEFDKSTTSLGASKGITAAPKPDYPTPKITTAKESKRLGDDYMARPRPKSEDELGFRAPKGTEATDKATTLSQEEETQLSAKKEAKYREENIPADNSHVFKKIAQVIQAPERGFRGIGVGLETGSIERAAEATKVGYEPKPGEKIGATLGGMAGSLPVAVASTAILPPMNFLGPGIIQRTAMAIPHGALANSALNILDQMARKGEIEPQEALVAAGYGAAFGAGLEASLGTAGLSLKILQRFRKGYYDESKWKPVRMVDFKQDEAVFMQELGKARTVDPATLEIIRNNPNVTPDEIIQIKTASGLPPEMAQEGTQQALDLAKFQINMEKLAQEKQIITEQQAKFEQKKQDIIQKVELKKFQDELEGKTVPVEGDFTKAIETATGGKLVDGGTYGLEQFKKAGIEVGEYPAQEIPKAGTTPAPEAPAPIEKPVGQVEGQEDQILKLKDEVKNYSNAEDFANAIINVERGETYTQAGELTTNIPVERFGYFGKDSDAIYEVKQSVQPEGVERWKKRIEAGERPPVIVWSYEFGRPQVIDGHHRLAAYRQLGFKEIPTIRKDSLIDFYNETKQIKAQPETKIEDKVKAEAPVKPVKSVKPTRESKVIEKFWKNGQSKLPFPLPPEIVGLPVIGKNSLKDIIEFRDLGLIDENDKLTKKGLEIINEVHSYKEELSKKFTKDIDSIKVNPVPESTFIQKLVNDETRQGLLALFKQGYASDGKILYTLDAESKKLTDAVPDSKKDSTPPNVLSLINPAMKFKDKVIGIEGVGESNAFKGSKLDQIYVIKTESGEQLRVWAKSHKFLTEKFPKATWYAGPIGSPLILKEGDKFRALEMPFKAFEKGIGIYGMKIEFTEAKMPVLKKPSGSKGASVGAFSNEAPQEGSKPEMNTESRGIFSVDVPVKMGGMDKIKPMELPEITRLAHELMGIYPKITTRFKTARGKFYGIGKGLIKLDAAIFAEPDQAAKTLAHEIGHLIDYLPEQTLSRGNLLGRLLSLQKFLKNTFGGIEVTNKEFRDELWALSQYWRPYDATTASKAFTAYRKGADELYADSVSVLLNSPGLLEERAPKFYKEFFNQLDKKPEVKESYLALQDFLGGSKASILAGRESDLRHGFAKAEELTKLKNEQKKTRDMRIWETLRQEWDNVHYPAIKKYQEAVARGAVIPDEENPMFALDELDHFQIVNHKFLNDVDEVVRTPLQNAGVTDEDFGTYLALRWMITGRKDIANPYGFTPKTAAENLANLEENLGPDKVEAIQTASDKFHELAFKINQRAVEVGAYNKEIFEKTITPNKNDYATFSVVDYFVEQGYVAAGVKNMVGTMSEIANPFTAMTMKMLSLNRLIAVQEAKNSVRDLLKNSFPGEIEPAQKVNPGAKIPIFKQKAERGILEILEDGKKKAYYIDPLIARDFEKRSPGRLSIAFSMLNALNHGIFHPLYVTFNAGFQVFNVQRDFRRTYKAIPGASISGLLREMYQAIPVAVRRQMGIKDELINKMLEDKALDLPMSDLSFGQDPDLYESLLIKHGLMAENKATWKKNILVKPFAALLDGLRFTGNVIESLGKIAGYNYRVKLGETGKKLAYNTRNFTGTPNYSTRGINTQVSNSVFMYSNIFLQAMKADTNLATNPTTRSGYWWKTIQIDLIPKFLMFLAAAGLAGKEAKDHYDRMSEYDKTNYITVPIGKMPGKSLYEWKTVYLRFPHDESGRLVSGVFWKMLNAINTGNPKKLQDVLSLGAGQLPNISPALTMGKAWGTFLTGSNPYDSFRGRNLIPETEYKAGTWPALKRMLQWTANQSGLVQIANYDPASKTTLEATLQSTPLFNRLIKISDYGMVEKSKEAFAELESDQAELRLLREPSVVHFMANRNSLDKIRKEENASKKQIQKWERYQDFYSSVILKYGKEIKEQTKNGKEEKADKLRKKMGVLTEKWLKREDLK